MAQAGGLNFVMQVTPGPYFLGELLEVDFSLRNDSHTTYTLDGPRVSGPCGAVFLHMSGGATPQYLLPVAQTPFNLPCNLDPPLQLTPGATITGHEFLPVSNTGTLTLQSGSAPSPLDGLWPSITLSVAAATPSDRHISLQLEGTQVQIAAPAAALAHLYYIYTVTCNDVQGGTAFTGNYAWEPISTTLMHEPGCVDAGGQTIKWSYAVSAPGYAIASGQVGS